MSEVASTVERLREAAHRLSTRAEGRALVASALRLADEIDSTASRLAGAGTDEQRERLGAVLERDLDRARELTREMELLYRRTGFVPRGPSGLQWLLLMMAAVPIGLLITWAGFLLLNWLSGRDLFGAGE